MWGACAHCFQFASSIHVSVISKKVWLSLNMEFAVHLLFLLYGVPPYSLMTLITLVSFHWFLSPEDSNLSIKCYLPHIVISLTVAALGPSWKTWELSPFRSLVPNFSSFPKSICSVSRALRHFGIVVTVQSS